MDSSYSPGRHPSKGKPQARSTGSKPRHQKPEQQLQIMMPPPVTSLFCKSDSQCIRLIVDGDDWGSREVRMRTWRQSLETTVVIRHRHPGYKTNPVLATGGPECLSDFRESTSSVLAGHGVATSRNMKPVEVRGRKQSRRLENIKNFRPGTGQELNIDQFNAKQRIPSFYENLMESLGLDLHTFEPEASKLRETPCLQIG